MKEEQKETAFKGGREEGNVRRYEEGKEEEEEEEEKNRFVGCLTKEQFTVVCVGAGLLALLLIIITIFFVTNSEGASSPLPPFPTGGDMLDFLVQTGDITERDGLQVTWYHRANNQSEMNKALTSDIMVLEADVTVQGLGTVNETSLPIMAHPPAIYSDNTLDQWLDAVLQSKKGIKLDFKSLKAVGPSLDLLRLKNQTTVLDRPVWVNADILHGPGVPGFYPVVNGLAFLSEVQQRFPEVTVSPGWAVLHVPLFPNVTYTQSMVQKMYEVTRLVPQKVTFPIMAVMARKGWPHISWLLSQLPSSSLTLWQGQVNPTVDDLLFVRDNSNRERVYYDINEPVLSQFKEAAKQRGRPRRFYSGGDLLDYFQPELRDGLDVRWTTVTNKTSLLALLTDGPGGMLVVPVGSGSDPAHPEVPVVEGSGPDLLLLQDCVDLVLASPRPWGLYLWVLDPTLLEPSLLLLRSADAADRLYRPVWVSMALSHGRFSTEGFIPGEEYLATVNRVFPYVTLAPSWPPPALGEGGYTAALVDDMEQLLEGAWQQVSLQLGAGPLGRSEVVGRRRLLEVEARYSLTLEHGMEVEEGMERGSSDDDDDAEFQNLMAFRLGNRERRFYCKHENYRAKMATS